MFFVWTNGGGPLQYIGAVLCLFQFLPHVLPAGVDRFPVAVILVATGFAVAAAFGMIFPQTARTVLSQWYNDFIELFPQNNNTLLLRTLLGFVVALTLGAVFTPDLVIFQLFLAVLMMRSFLRDIRDGGAQNNNNYNEHQSREAKLSGIVKRIQTMPMEEFVADTAMDKCSVSQLKKMLEIRSSNEKNNPTEAIIVERQELVEAIQKRRNFCDTCCICCEEYKEGDLLRVLPKCRHEFHVECMDQWAYSFANNKAKRKRDPTCPLCNQTFL